MERDLASVQGADDKAAVYPALSKARSSSKYSTGLDSSRLQLLPVAPANTTLNLQMRKWGRAVMWLTPAHEKWMWNSSETLIPSESLNSDIIKKRIVQRFQWIVLRTKVTNTLNSTLPNYCVFYSSLCPQVYSGLLALMGCHRPISSQLLLQWRHSASLKPALVRWFTPEKSENTTNQRNLLFKANC